MTNAQATSYATRMRKVRGALRRAALRDFGKPLGSVALLALGLFGALEAQAAARQSSDLSTADGDALRSLDLIGMLRAALVRAGLTEAEADARLAEAFASGDPEAARLLANLVARLDAAFSQLPAEARDAAALVRILDGLARELIAQRGEPGVPTDDVASVALPSGSETGAVLIDEAVAESLAALLTEALAQEDASPAGAMTAESGPLLFAQASASTATDAPAKAAAPAPAPDYNMALLGLGALALLGLAGGGGGGGGGGEPAPVLQPPSAVSLSAVVSALSEKASTATRTKVADINVTDPDGGNNLLTLEGADAAQFEIVGNALYLKAGVVLDYETRTAYSVTVKASDPSIAGSTPVSAVYQLSITDVDENAPTVGVTISDAAVAAGDLPKVTFTFSSAPVNFTQDDVSAVGGTLSGLAVKAGSGGLVYEATFTPAADYEAGGARITVGTGWQSAAGVPPASATAFTAFFVDTDNPDVVSVTPNAAARTVTIAWSENLDAGSEPAASAFTVRTGGVLNPVADVAISGKNVVLTLANPFTSGTVVNVAYVAPATSPLQDAVGNDAGGFTMGVVADGYVRGAQIYLDANANGTAEPGEILEGVITDESGDFVLPSSLNPMNYGIIAVGGVNVDTGIPVTIPLRAPANSTTINPLTTMVQGLIETGAAADAVAATTVLSQALGLTGITDLTAYDPISALADGDPNALAAQQAASTLLGVVALGSQGDAASASTVLQNIATLVVETAAKVAEGGETLRFSNPEVLTQVVDTAALGAAAVATIVEFSATIETATDAASITRAQSQFLDTVAPLAPSGLSAPAATNDVTPAVTVSLNVTDTSGGAAVAGDSVLFFIDGVQATTATVGAAEVAAGQLAVSLPALSEGPHDIVARVVDAAGNLGPATAPTRIVIDTVAPVAPLLSTVAGDDVVSSADLPVTVSGFGEPNATVLLDLGGQTVEAPVGADSRWSYTLSAADLTRIGQGDETLVARVRDAAGNVGNATERPIRVDTVAPTATATVTSADDDVAPVIGTVAAGGLTDDNTLLLQGTIAGTLGAGESVVVFDGATRLGVATVTDGNQFSFATKGLAEGAHAFTARIEDSAGNQGGTSTPFAVSVNAVVPTATVALSTAATVTNDTTPSLTLALTGTLGAGETVIVFDGTVRLGTATQVSGNTYGFTPSSALSAGPHAFSAVVESAVGNQGSSSDVLGVTIDLTAPTVTVTADDALLGRGDDVTLAFSFGESIVSPPALSVSGGGTVTTLSPTAIPGVYSAVYTPANGVASADLRVVGASTGSGVEIVVGPFADAAGNAGTVVSQVATRIDTQAPAAPTLLTIAGNDVISAAERAAGVTLQGVTEPFASVSIGIGTTTVRVAADASGGFSYAMTPEDFSALGQGARSIRASATDTAGNAGAEASRAVTVDTLPPVLFGGTRYTPPGFSESLAAGGVAYAPVLTDSSQVTYALKTGLGDDAALFSIDAASGVVRLQQPVDFEARQAPYQFTIVVDDGINTSEQAVTLPVLDANDNAPVLAPIAGVTVLEGLPVGTVVVDANATDADRTAANNTIRYSLANGDAALMSIDTVTGEVRFLSSPVFAQKSSYAFDVIASDGTLTASRPVAISIATDAAPTATVTLDQSVLSAGEQATVTVTFSEPVTGFTLADLSTAGGTLSALTQDPLDARVYRATLTPAADAETVNNVVNLGAGYTGVATGNSGTTATSATYTVDTRAPSATVSVADASLIAGETTTVTLTFSEPVSGLQLSSLQAGDGTLSGLTQDPVDARIYRATLTPGANVEAGSNTVTLSAGYTDAAGNPGASAASANYAVDTRLPTATLAVSDSLLATGETATVTITFSEPVTGLALSDLTAGSGTLSDLAQDALNPRVYTAKLTPAALTQQATNTVALSAAWADLAGNPGSTAASASYAVDTQAPAAPLITRVDDNVAPRTGALTDGAATNDTTPTLTLTAEAGSTVQVYDGATLLGAATETATPGTFTFTPTALAQGTYALKAIATDAAANVGAASATFTLTIDTQAPAGATITKATDNAAPVTGDLASGASSNDTTPTLTIEAPAGTTVSVYNGSTLLGTATETATPGTFTFTPDALAQGLYALNATAADAAGNASELSDDFTLTIDVDAPVTPTITQVSDNALPVTGNLTSGASTNDPTPTLTISAETGTTVRVFDGATLLGTATETATPGTFTFTPTGLAQGGHALTAVSTDAAGNVSAPSSGFALTVVTDAVATPVITQVADDAAPVTGNLTSGAATNDATPTLTITAQPGSEVLVYDGATLLGKATETATPGTFRFTPAALSQGAHALSAVSSDAAGNTSAPSADFLLTVDVGVPSAPSITQVADDAAPVTGNLVSGASTNDATPTLTITAEAGSTVTVYNGATLLGTATETGTPGTFTFTPGALAQGTYALNAIATDAAGNASTASAAFALTIDTAAPAAPVIAQAADNATPVTGNLAGGASTNDTTPTLTLTAEIGSTVQVFNGATLLGTATETATPGTFTFTPTALVEGTYALNAIATDAAGNASAPSTNFGLTIDTTPPAAPTITQVTDDATPLIGSLASGASTNDTTPALTITAPTGSTVTVYNGAALLGTATETATPGTFTFTPTALAQGAYALNAIATDAAGNASAPSSNFVLTVDTAAPAAPVVTLVNDNVAPVTGNLAGGASTNDTTPTLTLTAEIGSTVQVFNGATLLGTATETATPGTFTFTPTALTQGTYALNAIATDAAGNASIASASFALTVDTAAPVAPTITQVADDAAPLTGNLTNGGATNDTTPTLTITAEPGSTVQVYNGATLLGTATQGTPGTFTFTPTALTQGVYALNAIATDAAGNASVASANFGLTIDTTAPAVPTITQVADDVAPLTANLTNGGATNDTTPTLTITAETGSTVQVYNGATLLGTATETATPGTFTFTPTALAQGTYALNAVASDAVGNASAASANFGLTIDTAAPAAPTITQVADNAEPLTANLTNGGATNDTTPTLTITAESGSTVQVFNGATPLGTATETATPGTFTFTPTALAQGTYALNAIATDAAGNVGSASANFGVTVDTAAPAAPTIVKANDDVELQTGDLASGASTNDATPTLTITAEAGSTVRVFNGATLLGTATETGTAGTFTFTPSSALSGSPSLNATATDAAGNASAASANFTLTIDTTAPAVPTITQVADDVAPVTTNPTNGGATNDTTPTLTITAPTGSTVTVYDGATLLGTATETATAGTFTFTPGTALTQKAYAFNAKATDAVGNTSAASANFALTIDTAAPAAPTITKASDNAAPVTGDLASGASTNDTTPTLTITAEAGSTVQVYKGVELLGTATPTAPGATTFTYTPTALADALYTFSAIATDAAGNVSTASSNFTLTIVQPKTATLTSTEAMTLQYVLDGVVNANDDLATSFAGSSFAPPVAQATTTAGAITFKVSSVSSTPFTLELAGTGIDLDTVISGGKAKVQVNEATAQFTLKLDGVTIGTYTAAGLNDVALLTMNDTGPLTSVDIGVTNFFNGVTNGSTATLTLSTLTNAQEAPVAKALLSGLTFDMTLPELVLVAKDIATPTTLAGGTLGQIATFVDSAFSQTEIGALTVAGVRAQLTAGTAARKAFDTLDVLTDVADTDTMATLLTRLESPALSSVPLTTVAQVLGNLNAQTEFNNPLASLAVVFAGAVEPSNVTADTRVRELAAYADSLIKDGSSLDLITLGELKAVLPPTGVSLINQIIGVYQDTFPVGNEWRLSDSSTLGRTMDALQLDEFLPAARLSTLISQLQSQYGITVTVEGLLANFTSIVSRGVDLTFGTDLVSIETLGQAADYIEQNFDLSSPTSLFSTLKFSDIEAEVGRVAASTEMAAMLNTLQANAGIGDNDSMQTVVDKLQAASLANVNMVDLLAAVPDAGTFLATVPNLTTALGGVISAAVGIAADTVADTRDIIEDIAQDVGVTSGIAALLNGITPATLVGTDVDLLAMLTQIRNAGTVDYADLVPVAARALLGSDEVVKLDVSGLSELQVGYDSGPLERLDLTIDTTRTDIFV